MTSHLPHDKTVLWVDAFACYRDPSMRQLLFALPHLEAAGWKVQVWCLESDLPRDTVEHIFLPGSKRLGPFALVYFSTIANLYGLWRWVSGAKRPATIIHATCGAYLWADVASVHFVNCVWLRKHLELGIASWKEGAQFLLHCLGALYERLHWWSPSLRVVLAVSDAIAAEVRQRTRPTVTIETLPNAFDTSRFNLEVRDARRAPTREKLGFTADQAVFVFVSLGHHKRKGFWLAVEALALLRKDAAMGHTRFLVVGGLPATLANLQDRLNREYPDWRDWIVFTGQQPEVENYYAAADAFLYPSYFEAFCLAEIEAAAMGVPLLLTRHHGSEMVLRDKVNGLWLEFDPVSIAATLKEFLKTGPSTFQHSTGAALSRPAYAQRLLEIYQGVLQKGARAGDGSGRTGA